MTQTMEGSNRQDAKAYLTQEEKVQDSRPYSKTSKGLTLNQGYLNGQALNITKNKNIVPRLKEVTHIVTIFYCKQTVLQCIYFFVPHPHCFK